MSLGVSSVWGLSHLFGIRGGQQLFRVRPPALFVFVFASYSQFGVINGLNDVVWLDPLGFVSSRKDEGVMGNLINSPRDIVCR